MRGTMQRPSEAEYEDDERAAIQADHAMAAPQPQPMPMPKPTPQNLNELHAPLRFIVGDAVFYFLCGAGARPH